MLTELVMTFALASEEPTARVKAVLALSAAALKLQKQSTPPPLFFERLEFMPTPHDQEPPATRDSVQLRTQAPTLATASLLAARAGRPLIVWVNCEDSSLEATLTECVHVHVEAFLGSAEPGLVPQVSAGGWWYSKTGEAKLPLADADSVKVRGMLQSIRQHLKTMKQLTVRQVLQNIRPTITAAGRSC